MTDLFRVALPRDFVEVSGTDAATFLQGQLSQDIDVVRARGSAWSFLLQPQGKVDAWLRVSVAGPEAFVLDVDGGFGEAVVTRLNRFRLRVKVDISVLEWRCVAVRGDGASHVSGLDAEWPGIEGVDVVGPSVEQAAEMDAGRVGSIEDYERARILAGVPAMGREITTATIPAETGCPRALGELHEGVLHGAGARRPHRLAGRQRAAPRACPAHRPPGPRGARVEHDGRDVGEVTSAAADGGGSVALAVLARSVVPPASVTVVDEADRVSGEVLELPS